MNFEIHSRQSMGDLTPQALESFIRRLHAAAPPLVIATTGGGSLSIAHLLTVPGASRVVLEATVPYSHTALAAYFGGTLTEKPCSDATARAMAMAGWRRSRAYAGEPKPPLTAGLACTASLATNEPKRGAHRAHWALQTDLSTMSQAVLLEKGARSRLEEESLLAALLLNLLAAESGIEDRLPVELLPTETVESWRTDAPAAWIELLRGDAPCWLLAADSSWSLPAVRSERLIFPGAFNPLHGGHLRMAELAQDISGRRTEFELSIENVDKPPLDYRELAVRTSQFGPDRPVWLTRAPTFALKAALFPASTFVIGADTLSRLVDVRYYGGSDVLRDAALQEIYAHDARFLVFARQVEGHVRRLDDVSLPAELRIRCEAIPTEVFLDPVSSTKLRKGGSGEG